MKSLLFSFTVILLVLTGCATGDSKNTINGAAIGVAAGALLGGVLGNQQGSSEKGAAIGAVLGGVVGGAAGRRMDAQAKELEKIAETKRTEQGLVTKLKSDILFETGDYNLKDQATGNLTEMATIMKKYPENILTIKGYTDSTGSEKTNQVLSQKRAEAVKLQLVKNGIPLASVSTLGMGPANPVAENKTEVGRKLNRRVEIEVTVDESKIPKKVTK